MVAIFKEKNENLMQLPAKIIWEIALAITESNQNMICNN